MNTRLLFSCIASVVVAASAAPFQLTVQNGQAMVLEPSSVEWSPVDQQAEVSLGSAVLVPPPANAQLSLGSGTVVHLKDSCSLTLTGSESSLILALTGGELFFRRDSQGDASVAIAARGCTITPQGTAAAVKINRRGDPTVAVLRGRMRMAAPGGKAQEVGPGFFGLYDGNSGDIIQRELPPAAVTALEQWGGVSLEAPAATELAQADAQQPEEQDAAQEPVANETAQEVVPMAREVAPGQDQASEAASANAQSAAMKEEQKAEQAAEISEKQENKAQQKAEKKSAKRARKSRTTSAPKVTAAPPAASAEQSDPAQESGEGAEAGEDDATPAAAATSGGALGGGSEGPTYGLIAGSVTIDGQQWTQLMFNVDVPIWRFGVGLDVELFINDQGEFSSKGWDFSEDKWLESLTRKIRYVRLNHENDPLYIRFMALDDVTLGYGFIVNHFTNTLYYPEEKLLGLQVYLNDVGPIGLTVQSMFADFLDVRNDGGLGAMRVAVKPLKPTGIPLLSGLDIGATYARDENQYAPAREWEFPLEGDKYDRDQDSLTDSTYLHDKYGDKDYYDQLVEDHREEGDYDVRVEHEDAYVQRQENTFAMLGFDVGMPLISSQVLSLDVYGQMGMSMDDENDVADKEPTEGWGIGAPGVRLKAGPFWAQVEYRYIQGEFQPQYFDRYYLRERLTRDPIVTKEEQIESQDLNGAFGEMGMSLGGFIVVSGNYQRLIGDNVHYEFHDGSKTSYTALDQRFEAKATLGQSLLERVPKLSKAEAYFAKTRMQRTFMQLDLVRSDEWMPSPTASFDRFFERTPNTYWGYRLSAEVTEGAGITWDTRYGWVWKDGELVKDNTVTIAAGLSF
jgi:hypothetical protein